MISRKSIALLAFILLFFGVSAFMMYLRFRYNETHFRVGEIPQEVVSALLPKTVPLEQMRPPALRMQDPVRYGSATSIISVIEYGDFQCEYCRAMSNVIQNLLPSYQGTVRFVWRDYPLSSHSAAMPAAIFARCAALQGNFWGAYDELMKAPALTESSYQSIAGRLGLDISTLKSCRANPALETLIVRDRQEAQANGIQSVPLLFVGTKAIDSFIDTEALRKIIDEQLSST